MFAHHKPVVLPDVVEGAFLDKGFAGVHLPFLYIEDFVGVGLDKVVSEGFRNDPEYYIVLVFRLQVAHKVELAQPELRVKSVFCNHFACGGPFHDDSKGFIFVKQSFDRILLQARDMEFFGNIVFGEGLLRVVAEPARQLYLSLSQDQVRRDKNIS